MTSIGSARAPESGTFRKSFHARPPPIEVFSLSAINVSAILGNYGALDIPEWTDQV
jgi:hypothetical protein